MLAGTQIIHVGRGGCLGYPHATQRTQISCSMLSTGGERLVHASSPVQVSANAARRHETASGPHVDGLEAEAVLA
jgi:hypothetical protein